MSAPNNQPLSFVLPLPFDEAIQAVTGKGNRITWSWRDMTSQEHALEFTVAKAMSLDILADIRTALERAIKEGRTERLFAKDLEGILKAKGWWGQQEMIGPDGKPHIVQLGSPRRLETIFRTNLQTAYMRGRHQQMIANADDRPYWQYVAVMDSRTRAAHRALHGKVFRFDDPVWGHIYPPNGFRCRCRVRALSGLRLDREGLQVEDSRKYLTRLPVSDDPLAPTVALRLPGMNEPFIPDPGFDYNPGKSLAAWDKNALKPDCPGGFSFAERHPGNCIRILPGQKNWRDYGRPDLRDVGDGFRLPAPQLLTKGADTTEALAILKSTLKVGDGQPMRVINTPVDPVVIRAEWLPHLVAKRDQTRERYAQYIVPTLENPFEVWLTAYEDGYRRRFIGLFRDQRDLLSVVRENRDGSVLWNIIRMKDTELNKQRTGELIWKK
ncbi:hypothetical protein SIID45300_01032 [Candidatus Magnetaquicoccaceae bacterium FCR-1]|uniref:Phage head morphogenesis protein n=1 Tax=Candidatus Magnetaquiglobus chichijimensis TaxID=3141448 RepID=A0ABQ0C759_9PROT